MREVVIVDTSIFIHANYHILKDKLNIEDDVQLAMNVCNQIRGILMKHFSLCEPRLVLDSDANFRKSIYDQYKANRSPAKFNREIVHDYIQKSFNCWQYQGLEADDLAFLLSVKHPTATLLSEDGDYEMMLTEHNRVYKYKSNTFVEGTKGSILMNSIAKIVEGCEGDNVPKIKLRPFGPKFLSGFLNPEMTLFEHLDLLQDLEYISDWRMNYDLVFYDLDTYNKHFDIDEIINTMP